MTDEQQKMLRRQVSQVRSDLRRILDWIESEVEHSGPAHNCKPTTIPAADNGAEVAALEEQETP